jgi:hypothetical protein
VQATLVREAIAMPVVAHRVPHDARGSASNAFNLTRHSVIEAAIAGIDPKQFDVRREVGAHDMRRS